MLQIPSRHDLALKFLYVQIFFLALALLLFAFPTTAHAAACSGTLDYGDAPSSYGVACADRATNLYIGSTAPDEESGNQPSTNAVGDDNNATDDENFLNPLTPIDVANSQYIWTVPVSNTTGGSRTLAGWIDFNANGSFESSEGVSTTVPNNSTAVTLTWTIPHTGTSIYTGTLPITTYVRLRISPASNIGPTDNLPAATSNGEVEDYTVAFVESDICAPGTSFYYIQVGSSSNDFIATVNASTGITTFVNNPPTPSNGIPGINGLAVDRYRGFIYHQENADVDCDPGPGCSGTLPQGIFAYNLLNATNSTITTNASGIGIPLTNGWQTASGAFANGKYYVGIDGDDTGRIYEVTLNSAGTSALSSRLLISPAVNGACVPNNPTGGNECRGYGDLIIDANRMYVALWQGSGSPDTQIFDVYDINSGLRLSRQIVSSDGFAYQLGRNGNGQIYAVTSDNGRIYQVVNGQIQTGSLISTIGAAVRDASECLFVPMDFGDAPIYYSPNVGPLAARSSLSSNIRLGSVSSQAIISDTHGNASSTANGDDTTGPSDDEEAVSSIPSLSSSSSSYSLPNITVFNNSGSPVFLYGWVDFDRDGVFEASERVTTTIPSSASSQSITLTWSIPGGSATTGQSFIRLRISSSTVTTSTLGTGNDGAFLPTGYAPNGEVEDYPLTIGAATAVTLLSIKARTEDPSLTLLLPKGVPGWGDALVGFGIGAAGAIVLMLGLVLARKRFRT